MQSKFWSHAESATSLIVGMIIAYLVLYFVIAPLQRENILTLDSLLIPIIFAVASYLRLFLCRRFFNAREKDDGVDDNST